MSRAEEGTALKPPRIWVLRFGDHHALSPTSFVVVAGFSFGLEEDSSRRVLSEVHLEVLSVVLRWENS